MRPGSLFAVEAQQLLALGKAAEAIELCKHGLVYYPDHIAGYAILSQAYLDAGQKERALNVLHDGYRRTSASQLEELRTQLTQKREMEPATFGRNPEGSNGADRGGFEHFLPQSEARPTGSRIELDEEEPAPEWAARITEPPGEPSIGMTREEETARPLPEATRPEGSMATETAATGTITRSAAQSDAASNSRRQEEPVTAGPSLSPITDKREVPEAEVSIGNEGNVEERRQPEGGVEEKSSEKEGSDERDGQPESGAAIRIFPELQRIEPVPAITTEIRNADRVERSEGEKASVVDPAATDRGRYLSLATHAGKNVARLRSSNLRLIPGLEFAPLRSGDNPHRQPIAPLINEPLPQLKFPERGSKGSLVGAESLTAVSSQQRPGDTVARQEERPRMMQPHPEIPGVDHGSIESAAPPLYSSERLQGEGATVARRRGRAYLPPSISLIEEQAGGGFGSPLLSPERENEELTPLEELARRLEHARIPVVEEEEPQSSYEPSIISETLANILVAQGKYVEALKAFQTLARTKPERYEYFQQKITEMKWRLQNPGESWPPGEEASSENPSSVDEAPFISTGQPSADED
jgi:hypothetical protein